MARLINPLAHSLSSSSLPPLSCHQINTQDSEPIHWDTETTLSMDDARTILSLNQKKKGPVSKPELVALVTGLTENLELVETGGVISAIFRTKLEFSNEDQFFSIANKNLTALQQLYVDQSKEVRGRRRWRWWWW